MGACVHQVGMVSSLKIKPISSAKLCQKAVLNCRSIFITAPKPSCPMAVAWLVSAGMNAMLLFCNTPSGTVIISFEALMVLLFAV